MKTATTIEEQIQLLRSRGMEFPNEEKAKEILLDIGYYRLGFYWFRIEVNFRTFLTYTASNKYKNNPT